MVSPLSLTQHPLALSPETPVHFIGIGGIGMSALAKILLEAGYRVQGSDLKESGQTRQLQGLGATIFMGHQAGHVPQDGIVIHSTAVHGENPEFSAAKTQGIPLYHRSDLLQALLHSPTLGHEVTVGLTGTHGKTTMTGMTSLALMAGNLNTTIIAGGVIPSLETNGLFGGDRRFAVAELDESDGTIVQYQPTFSVIANLELDHADHFTEGLSQLVQTFRTFVLGLKPGSKVLVNVACENTKALLGYLPEGVTPILLAAGDVFTGAEPETTYWIKNARLHHRGCYQAYVYKNRRMLGELNLAVPGKHNLFNALAALAVGDQLKVPFEAMAEALAGFTGMGRRFEKVGEANGAWLVDDYAHHPTEVLATLKAARESTVGEGRVIAIFQPHRYSRLQALWEEFRTCFGEADEIYLTDVYSAGEEPLPEATAEKLAASMVSQNVHPHVRYISKGDWTSLKSELIQKARPTDILLSLGAGDITQFFRG